MLDQTHSKDSPPKYFTDTMLVPKYVTQFRCLGGNCPDTCCAGWSINVDKDSFQEYRRVIQPTLKPLLKTFLIQVDKDSEDKHGRMNLRPTDSHCGLHAADGSCTIQQTLGEDALCDTCFAYPRNTVQFGERFEQTLTLSCPEAARLALTLPDAFEFVSAEFTARLATTLVFGPVGGYSHDQMDDVRFFCIQLFQTEGLSNTERLAALGWLCQQLDELVTNDTQATVGDLLSEMTSLVESGRIHSIVDQLSHRQEASVTIFATLFGSTSPSGSVSIWTQTLEAIRSGLGIDTNLDWEKISANYRYGNTLLMETGEMHAQLMGRYLLNDLVKEIFPWGRKSAMEHYRRLLTRYGILRLMLAGRAAGKGTALSAADMVETTQIFCRFYQHNMVFATKAENLLTSSNWTRLDHLYALLN
jgi:lysine-N-methylase